MIAAQAQQHMARTGAITALLTNRDNLGPALQQQLDTGMAGYMARLFGGALKQASDQEPSCQAAGGRAYPVLWLRGRILQFIS